MIDLTKGLATAGLSDFWVIVFVKRMNTATNLTKNSSKSSQIQQKIYPKIAKNLTKQ